MLGKLLKYDFKSLYKTLIPVFGITLILAIFTRIANMLANKIAIIEYPAGLITGLCVMLIIGIPFVAFVVGIIKYYNNMVKDEGYLTHTLPVKKSQLVLSKLISSTVAVVSSLCVSLLAILLAFNINKELIDVLKTLYDEIMNYDKWIILLVLLSIFVGYISNVLLIYASISLGQTKSGNKIVYSIVYGLILYNVVQVVSTLILFIPYFFNENYLTYLEQDMPPANFINGFLIFALIISIIICIGYYFITVKVLNKKLNLD